MKQLHTGTIAAIVHRIRTKPVKKARSKPETLKKISAKIKSSK